MKLSYYHVLALAFFRLAATAHGAPTGTAPGLDAVPSSSVDSEASKISQVGTNTLDQNGVHVGVGAKLPEQVKGAVHSGASEVNSATQHAGRGLPVRVGEGNAEETTLVPTQNYENDVARLPVVDAVTAPAQ